ncbi:MAG: hypothetical protein WD969_15405 [Paracoccaceae bacterium]
MAYPSYASLRWFRFLIGLGFALNLLFILPGFFAPRWLETMGDFGITNTPHWLQNVSLLLAIVTALYIPVIRDPFRYLFCSVLVVAGRFSAGVLFIFGVWFMDYPEGMFILASADIVLSLAQALALRGALRDGDPRVEW